MIFQIYCSLSSRPTFSRNPHNHKCIFLCPSSFFGFFLEASLLLTAGNLRQLDWNDMSATLRKLKLSARMPNLSSSTQTLRSPILRILVHYRTSHASQGRQKHLVKPLVRADQTRDGLWPFVNTCSRMFYGYSCTSWYATDVPIVLADGVCFLLHSPPFLRLAHSRC